MFFSIVTVYAEENYSAQSGEVSKARSVFNVDRSTFEQSFTVSLYDNTNLLAYDGQHLTKYLDQNVSFYFKQAVSPSGSKKPAYSYKADSEDASSSNGVNKVKGTYNYASPYSGNLLSKYIYVMSQYDSLNTSLGDKKAYYAVQYAINSITNNLQFSSDGSDVGNAVANLITNANKKSAFVWPKISVKETASAEYTLESDNKYYIVSRFSAVIGDGGSGKLNIELNGEPSGTVITTLSGQSISSINNNSEFLIKVPADDLTENSWYNFDIVISAKISSLAAALQYDNEGGQILVVPARIGGTTSTTEYYKVAKMLNSQSTPTPSSTPENEQDNNHGSGDTPQELNETPVTGDSLIYFVWIVGIAVVGGHEIGLGTMAAVGDGGGAGIHVAGQRGGGGVVAVVAVLG